jgi:hypothetical protein
MLLTTAAYRERIDGLGSAYYKSPTGGYMRLFLDFQVLSDGDFCRGWGEDEGMRTVYRLWICILPQTTALVLSKHVFIWLVGGFPGVTAEFYRVVLAIMIKADPHFPKRSRARQVALAMTRLTAWSLQMWPARRCLKARGNLRLLQHE